MLTFYLAWVDPEEDEFDLEFARHDENMLSFAFDHQEGDFASLKVEVRNPIDEGAAIGLLAIGRKRHVWLSYSDGGDPVPLFFGRLVGIPTSVFQSVVTLDFIARPSDLNEQKEALAESLKVLPWYDPIFIDEQSRSDVDLVLEAYAKVWHYDPVTHQVTVSDILTGEDGTEVFERSDHQFDGLELELGSTPLGHVSVSAELTWTQIASGTVDLSEYIRANWPNETYYGNVITSFTLSPDSWPQPGTALQDGWEVSFGEAKERYDLEVRSRTGQGKREMTFADGSGGTVQSSFSDDYISATPPGSITVPQIVTNDNVNLSQSWSEGNEFGNIKETTSFSRSLSFVDGIVPLHHLSVTLNAAYSAERPCTETVSFTVTSDLQPIVTLPGDDEAMELTFKSSNLSEPIDPEGTEPDIPIGDVSRRSYLVSERGRQSLEHLILRARAHLLMRSRAVSVSFQPNDFASMVELSLRKNATVHDWRIPGGQASGKIVGYSISLNGDKGVIECKCKIGCAIGRGGVVVAEEGTGLYVDADAMGPDIQEFEGRTELIDSSIGYEPPLFNPNDDGLDFSAPLTALDVLEEQMTVQNPPGTQRAALDVALEPWKGNVRIQYGVIQLPETLNEIQEKIQQLVTDRAEAVKSALESVPTVAQFKLKSMKRSFSSPYEIVTTQLKIPAMIDLEASSGTA